MAVANASEVWPDGKEGPPPSLAFITDGLLTKGLSRFTMYLVERVMAVEIPIVSTMKSPFFTVDLSWDKRPFTIIDAGTPRHK